MDKKVAIRVKDEDHGAMVIKYLESIGGRNTEEWEGKYAEDIWGIKNGEISPVYERELGKTHTLITLEEVEFINKKEKTFPRTMLVWDRDCDKREAEVHGHIETLEYPWIAEGGIGWTYAEELPEKEEVEEMTLEEVCKPLGKEVKIVK